MKLNVVFYGGLKQQVGAKRQALEFEAESMTVRELGALLQARFPALAPRLESVMVAVDDRLVEPDHVLRDGDEAALLPPVSGG